jgi:hypothetical protein
VLRDRIYAAIHHGTNHLWALDRQSQYLPGQAS